MISQPKKLNYLQINLQHSKVASLTLAQTILDFDIDIVFIQEPYAYQLSQYIVVPNIPTGYQVIHALDSNHAYGAAIIHKSNIKAQKIH